MPQTPLVIRLKPKLEAVTDMLDRLEAYAAAAALPAGVAHRLAVVCEEVAANVAMHGASGDGAATYVEITVVAEDLRLLLAIEDDGRPFDPLAAAAADTDQDIEDRPIGGLGIHFMRNMVQDLAYERCDGRNRLTAALAVTG